MGRPPLDPSLPPTQERLVAAAAEVFAREGFAAAPLAAIASQVGIRRPSLLYHFPTKEALYGAVIHAAFARLDAALQPAFALEGDFAARLEAVTQGYLRFLDEEPTFAPLLLRELLDGQGPGQALIRDGLVPLLDGVCAFLEREGGAPGGLTRQGLLALASSGLLRAAAGGLREPLWGSEAPPLPALARLIFLGQTPAASLTTTSLSARPPSASPSTTRSP